MDFGLSDLFEMAKDAAKMDYKPLITLANYAPEGEDTQFITSYIGTLSRLCTLLSGVVASTVDGLVRSGAVDSKEGAIELTNMMLVIAVGMGLRPENIDILSNLYAEKVLLAASSFSMPEKEEAKVGMNEFIENLKKAGLAKNNNSEVVPEGEDNNFEVVHGEHDLDSEDIDPSAGGHGIGGL
jgi:hypothetical protein